VPERFLVNVDCLEQGDQLGFDEKPDVGGRLDLRELDLLARIMVRNGPQSGGDEPSSSSAIERENPRFAGVFDAAEWSRTITGVSTHKALNLARLPVPPQPLEGG
jgi:hypothetical protein